MNHAELLAWNEIQERLKSLAYRYTKDWAAAEDIVQDVFLKVHDRLGQLRDPKKLNNWLFRITRNAINDYFRDLSRSIPEGTIAWQNEGETLNDCVESCLKQMLQTIPEKYRAALELTGMKQMSQTELATTLNISYSGAKSRVQRARQMLREKMESHYGIQFDSYGNVLVCENRVACNCPPQFSEASR
jgi:RNA polymerase sigma-70 factor (ECF subfamily)